ETWATALSAQPLFDLKAVSVPSIRDFATSFNSTCGVAIVSLDQKLHGDINCPGHLECAVAHARLLSLALRHSSGERIADESDGVVRQGCPPCYNEPAVPLRSG